MAKIKGDFLAHVKDVVTIMRPMPSTIPRGPASPVTNHPPISLRLPISHREPIEQAAALLGMPRSEFIRWCAYYTALDILRQKTEYDKLK